MSKRFAMTGVAGFVAPRHLRAIKDTGNHLVAAMDPHDSVGILDKYFRDVAYFREPERFDRHLDKLRREKSTRIDYFSICSPNFLHDAHIRMALRVGSSVLCEKPLVLNPWNCDALSILEDESEGKINTALQLRCHPVVTSLKDAYAGSTKKHSVNLTYITSRGPWYLFSWKGNKEKSGGLATNIGVHFFDMLLWVFGNVEGGAVVEDTPELVSGIMELERAIVTWKLSINRKYLPAGCETTTFRSITVDGEEVEFSGGFTDLHTEVYRRTLEGKGFTIEDARPSIQLVHNIREGKPLDTSVPT